MNKHTFLKRLSERLAPLPQSEIERLVEFYAELIDDKVENGESEVQAVENLGPVDEIAAGIMSEERPADATPGLEKAAQGNGYGARLAVTICTFPIWLPLYISGWAVIVSLYAAVLAFIAAGAAYIIPSLLLIGTSPAVSIFQVGVCLVSAGVGLFLLIGTNYITKYFCIFTRYLLRGIRHSFRKGARQS